MSALEEALLQAANQDDSRARAKLIAGLESDGSNCLASSSPMVLELTGWASSAAGESLNTAALQRSNRGSKVQFTRHHRPDLFSGLRRNRAGFRLRIETSNPEGVCLEVVSGILQLAAATPAVTEIARACLGPQAFANPQPAAGYIDTFVLIPMGSTAAEATLLRFPEETLRAARRDLSGAFARSCALAIDRVAPGHPLTARLHFLAGEIRQAPDGWKLVGVSRPFQNNPKSDGVQLPIPVRSQSRVQFHSSLKEKVSGVPVGWCRVTEATVQDGSVVIADGNLIVVDNSGDPSRGYVSGQQELVFSGGANQQHAWVWERPSGLNIERGVLLSGRNDANWYHTVCEYLPRSIDMDEFVPLDVPVIVSSNLSQAALDLLKLLTNREILVVDREQLTHVNELYLAQPRMQILDEPQHGWADGLSCDAAALRGLRNMIRSRFATPDKKYSRVYLVRNSGRRRLLNDRRLARIASRLGLTIIDPAQLEIEDQMQLFANAEIVVGAGGAVMANYLFLPEGARVLSLTSWMLWNFIHPAVLAELAGAKFEYLLSSPGKSKQHVSSQADIHQDFRVSPRQFRSSLREVLNGVSKNSESDRSDKH